MPKELYDEEGNPIPEAYLPDEVEELKKQIKEKEDQLNKLKDKDLNFSNFRKKTAEEMEKLTEGWSEREKGFLDQINSLHARIDERDNATLGKAKEAKLAEIAGEDEVMQAKIKEQFERLGGKEALSVDDVNRVYEEAAIIVKFREEKAQQVNPLASFVPESGGKPKLSGEKVVKKAETDALAKSLGINLD